MEEVSIIIPSFCRSDYLKYTLPQYKKQTIKSSVIVINDGKDNDETEDICIANGADCYFTGLRNKDGLYWRSPSIPINRGVSLTDSPFIFLTSPEIFILDTISLETLLKPLKENPYVLTTLWVKDDDGRCVSALKEGRNPEFHSDLTDLRTNLPFFLGMNRQRFIDIGGYDESFSDGVGWEDNDFVDRLTGAGCFYSQHREMKAVHLYHGRTRDRGIKDGYLKNMKLYRSKK